MAARKRLFHSEQVRERIKASQLINRLQNNAMGDKPIMDQGQIQSARILLNKILPDLSATTISGDASNPLVTEIRHTIVDPKLSGAANS